MSGGRWSAFHMPVTDKAFCIVREGHTPKFGSDHPESVEDVLLNTLPPWAFMEGVLYNVHVRVDHDSAAGEASFPCILGEMGNKIGGLYSTNDGELRVYDGDFLSGAVAASFLVGGWVVPYCIDGGDEMGVIDRQQQLKLFCRDKEGVVYEGGATLVLQWIDFLEDAGLFGFLKVIDQGSAGQVLGGDVECPLHFTIGSRML